MADDLSLKRLLFTLNALSEFDGDVVSPGEFKKSANTALSMVVGALCSTKGVIFFYDRGASELSAVSGVGLSGVDGLKFKGGFYETWFEGLRKRKPLDIKRPVRKPHFPAPLGDALDRMGMRVTACLCIKDEPLGLIAIDGRSDGQEYTQRDFDLLSVMAGHISLSLHNQHLLTRLIRKYNDNRDFYENLGHIYYDTIYAFAAAIDAKDAYTKGHSNRVSMYSTALAREMDLAPEEIEGVAIAGFLHDIGKIAVDKSIINKAGPLTSNECGELNSHPVVGYEILSKVKFPWKGIQMIARSHHERVDGTGYPDRLKKDAIPVGARIMALVDAFDAMTTDRPYRPRLNFREAMGEVRANLSRQFDPEVVRHFMSLIRKEASGNSKRAVIIPFIGERLNPATIKRVLEGFPETAA